MANDVVVQVAGDGDVSAFRFPDGSSLFTVRLGRGCALQLCLSEEQTRRALANLGDGEDVRTATAGLSFSWCYDEEGRPELTVHPSGAWGYFEVRLSYRAALRLEASMREALQGADRALEAK
jgi:hypothetical protein